MIQIVDSSVRQLPSLRFTQKVERRLTRISQQADDNQKHKLQQIVKKHRKQHYINTFRSKIKRNNIYQPPVKYQLMTNDDKNHSFLHVQGIQIKSKAFQSFIFAGDILFTLIIFYISVFQAFLQGFSVSQSSSVLVISLKVIAIGFEFSKILIKSIKKDMVNGKLLIYIDQILWNSTGIFELLLYSSALLMIFLTIIYPLSYSINVLGFFIATIKLFKIPINLKVLDLHYITSHRKQCYWNLIKIIIFQLIFMHFVAAVLLAMVSLHENNWLVAHSLEKSSWETQYFWALYWSATLISTTGFGDYAAVNLKQAIIVAFLELFSSVVLAYNLNLIGVIVMSLRDSEQSLQKKLAVFRRINDESPLSAPLQQKIHSHIGNQRQIHEIFQFIERKKFLDELPEQLRAEYKNDVNHTIFRQLPYFGCLRLETLNNLALQFTSKVCYPKENLIPIKEESNTIHILKRGAVSFHFHKVGATFMNQTIIETLQTQGNSSIKPILLNTAFLGRSRLINYDMKAQEYSLIMSLPQITFMETIRKSDIEKEHFFTIYDKHESNFVFEAIKCQYCNEEYHSKFQCSKLHYIPFKSEIVRRYIQQDGKRQGRTRFFKQVQRKEHCYYLRKSFYQPYEGFKNIAGKQMTPTMINRLIRMKTLAQQFDRQDLLQSFETIFRKIFKQQKVDSLGGDKNIDVDVLHDYLSYFIQSNPKSLDFKRISKYKTMKRQKLSQKLSLLANNAKRHLYRSLNQFDQGYEQRFFGEVLL